MNDDDDDDDDTSQEIYIYICAKNIGCTGLIVWLRGFSKEHGRVMIFKWKQQVIGIGCGRDEDFGLWMCANTLFCVP